MKIKIDENTIYMDSQKLSWGMEREAVRTCLKLPLEVHDEEFDFLDPPVLQKRDIFGTYEKGSVYIFCNYDEQEKLNEFEIHLAGEVEIAGTTINFGEPVLQEYLSLSPQKKIFRDEDGSLVLPELNITMASSEEMGGEGDGLDYIYFSNSIEHLGEITEDNQ